MKSHLERQFWCGVLGGGLAVAGIILLAPPAANPVMGVIMMIVALGFALHAGIELTKATRHDQH